MKLAVIAKIVFITLMILLFGCTGPKFMSRGIKTADIKPTIPSHKDLSLRVNSFLVNSATETWNNKLAGQLFTEILIGKLKDKDLFNNIIVVSADESAKTDLLLEITLENMVKKGWWERSRNGRDSSVTVTGRVIDVSQDTILLLFAKDRSGSGGLLGSGGLFTAGEKTMLKKLMEWLTEDVVEILEKGIIT